MLRKQLTLGAARGLAFSARRRSLLRGLLLTSLSGYAGLICPRARAQEPERIQDEPNEQVAWVCPMHIDYITNAAGTCPLCGMILVQARPFDERDYGLDFSTVPAIVRSGEKTVLQLKALRPGSDEPVTNFFWVHTKQWHLFVISQDMEYFQHIHPVMAADGTWTIEVVLPRPGYYKVLSDFFPGEGAAQFLARPLITAGYNGDMIADGARLTADILPMSKSMGDLTATVTTDPPAIRAEQMCRVNFHLTDTATGKPVTDLQTYLGAFGHALMVSEDMVDYVHVHPLNILLGSDEDGAPPIFLIPPDADLDAIRGGPDVTLEAVLPRPGRYRVWMQMQRHNQLHTFVVNLNAGAHP